MRSKCSVITAMLIFGSIGLFVRAIGLPSALIAQVRGIVGCLFLALAALAVRQPVSWKALGSNKTLLFFSGAAIGINWIFLFEAYRYTTVSCATLSYYFAPVFVTFLSPLILREKLTAVKAFCILAATAGMALVADVLHTQGAANHLLGIFMGLMAAGFYASVVLMNQRMKRLSGVETTVAQLGAASLVLLPYTLATQGGAMLHIPAGAAALLLVVGVVHTGVAYYLYFSGMGGLRSQTVAALGYIDPITAVALSALFLHEQMSGLQIAGAVLVLGSTWIGERYGNRRSGTDPIP